MKLIILIIIMIPNIVFAQNLQIYEGFSEYIVHGNETIQMAKQKVKELAIQNAREKAGIYISSYSVTNNLQITQDEIEMLMCNIVHVKDVKYNYKLDNNLVYTANVKVIIDADEINNWLKKDELERERLNKQNSSLNMLVQQKEDQYETIKAQLITVQNPTMINKLFQQEDNLLQSRKKMIQAKNYTEQNDLNNAIQCYTEAIKLDKGNPNIYWERGLLYYKQCKYYLAIADFTKALEYIQETNIYLYRACSYYQLNNEQCLNDIAQAIQLSPEDEFLYQCQNTMYKVLYRKEN